MTVPMSRRVVIFVVVSFALFMSSLDSTIVATALHALQHGLHTSLTWAGWTITSYSLGLLAMLALAGKIAERYGRRRVFIFSVTVFSIASLLCGFAQNIYVLIAFRLLQAMGGAGITPAVTGIIVDHFGPSRDKAVGLFGSIFTIGATVGPVLGGIIVHYWSWRGVFLVNVPLGLLLIPLSLRFIPADKKRRWGRKERLDILGALYLAVGTLGMMIGLTFIGSKSTELVWLCISAFVVAVLMLSLFFQHIRHSKKPIIAPKLIYGKGFGAVNAVNILYGGLVSGLTTLVPLYAITRYNISVIDAGTILAAQAVGAIVFTSFGAVTLRRTGYRKPIHAGALLIIVGMVMLAIAPIHMSAYAWIVIAVAIIGVGSGLLSPASRNAGLQLVPNHAPSLAALRTTCMQVGIVTAVSVATVIIDHAHAPSSAQGWIYAFFPLILLLMLPIINRIPEHKGFW